MIWKVRKSGEWVAWNQATDEIFLFDTGDEAIQFVHEELMKVER